MQMCEEGCPGGHELCGLWVKGRAGQGGHAPSLAGNGDGRTSLCGQLGEAHLHLRNLVAVVVPSP